MKKKKRKEIQIKPENKEGKRKNKGSFKEKNFWVFFWVVVVVVIGLRFLHLEAVPYFIQEDEMVYTLNARFVWLTGQDKTGTWEAASLTPIEPWFNELSAVVWAAGMGLPFGNLVNSRTMSGILGVGVAFLIGGIVRELTRGRKEEIERKMEAKRNSSEMAGRQFESVAEKQIKMERQSRIMGGMATMLTLINPWMWQISRMNFDIWLSFFFYVLGGWLFLKLKGWAKMVSVMVFFLGFYQYQGYKLLLAPWVVILAVWLIWPEVEKMIAGRGVSSEEGKKKGVVKAGGIGAGINVKNLIIGGMMVVFSIGLTVCYAKWQLPSQETMEERGGDILWPDNRLVQEKIEQIELETLNFKGKGIIINKWLSWISIIIDRYVNIYDSKLLFWETGEAGVNTYWMWYWGLFYLVDIVLIGGGIGEIVKKKDWRLGVFLGLLLLVAPLPALLNANGTGEWWLHRASFRMLPLLILAGIGAGGIGRKMGRWGRIGLAMIYGVNVVIFSWMYFYRLPVTAAINNRYAPRVIADYLGRTRENGMAKVYLHEGREMFFDSWLFYNDLIARENATEWQEKYRKEDYGGLEEGQVSFLTKCFPAELLEIDKKTTFIIQSGLSLCKRQEIGENWKEGDDISEDEVKREWGGKIIKTTGRRVLSIQDPRGGDVFFIIGDKICDEEATRKLRGLMGPEDFKTRGMSDEEWCERFVVEL